MKRWETILFGLSSLAIVLVIGYKLHELDMPAARFVRSFNIEEVNRIGDMLAVAGKGLVIGGIFAILAGLGWWFGRMQLKEIGLRGFGAQVVVALVSQIMKHTIGRPRPRFTHGDEFLFGPSLAGGLDSFPSGHAINAFAAAAVVGWFIPRMRTTMFLFASLVAISRVVRGSHFPTDVYAGAVLGILIGSVIAAGFKRWGQKVVPTLIRTAVPTIVFVFLLIWVALHPVPPKQDQLLHLSIGGAVLLVGVLLRGMACVQKNVAWRWRSLGTMVLSLGVGIACGPWWAAALLFVALLPQLFTRRDALSGETATTLAWRREALAVSIAVLGVVVFYSAQGILPLAS
jgi:undecaprenyl-diphosphatase